MQVARPTESTEPSAAVAWNVNVASSVHTVIPLLDVPSLVKCKQAAQICR